jgi:ribonuclease D
VAIDIQWIGDNASLAQHCATWRSLAFVAVDTEFMRVDTFYPIAGLLQVSEGERAYLIDPLLISDWTPFAELLQDPAVVKVLHACSEDLEVFLRLTGSLPGPLFDTQLAAGYLNLGFSMGYSRLVQAVLNIELPKGETRSDWLQRPLSATQVSYAAEDVLHLAEVYAQLKASCQPRNTPGCWKTVPSWSATLVVKSIPNWPTAKPSWPGNSPGNSWRC